MNINRRYLSALLLCDVLFLGFGVGFVCELSVCFVCELSVDYTNVFRLC